MRTATTKVRRGVYEEFQRVCQDQETTPYAVLRDFLLAFVDYFGNGEGAPDEEESAAEVEGLSSSSSGPGSAAPHADG